MNTSLYKHPMAKAILGALNAHGLSGDAYISDDQLFQLVKLQDQSLRMEDFTPELSLLLRKGMIVREGTRLYSCAAYRYEQYAAEELAEVLSAPPLSISQLARSVLVCGSKLCPEQSKAADMALSSRISMILGGAGSGKTTLISTIAQRVSGEKLVVCAPTGKAAYNLREKTGLRARTIHSALGLLPNEDFLADVPWEHVNWVIVDEASMMTLEMLGGFLSRLNPDAHLVLLGDPNQLPAVGVGNVLPDLMELGFPSITLLENHRQEEGDTALMHNVVNFSQLATAADLAFDDSFQFQELTEKQAQQQLVTDAVERYRHHKSVQVLATTKRMVLDLNREIQAQINPHADFKREVIWKGMTFRDGDKVLITRNNRYKDCFNGDVGTFRILEQGEYTLTFCVALPDGREPTWHDEKALSDLSLAYAMTAHKAQGSEYDTVLFPITGESQNMMYRNMLYTTISRARSQVVLYGSRQALDSAMRTTAKKRKSMLVAKTHMLMATHRTA